MKAIDKLKSKLAELFQLDQADLDFGIYRIMNAKRGEITHFLEQDLLPQVKQAFKEYKPSDKAEIQKELDKVIEGVKAAGMDPEQSPKVKELRARLNEDAVDLTALENEVYSRLYDFFSRYYDGGDFISLRRYKKDVYAIPYEGEEVKLHWANADQYYIKTTEYFHDYAFKVGGNKLVRFKIIEADTEKDNRKAANGNDRRFFLHDDNPVAEEKGELVIRFEYRPDPQKRKQEALNAETIHRLFADLNTRGLAEWLYALSIKAPTEKNPDRTVLEKHLTDYTKRNTFDYFIHKDLGGFLRRELDFFIKNEVMHLDDVENESVPRVEQYLSKIRVIRKIAHKIIDFLAQIEDFQKKLWLKKKFVVETNYCVTLDRVPEELYSQIAANEAQREEWVRLFAIDEIKKDLAGAVDYSEPLTVEFLKANNKLVLDTQFFDEAFKARLIASIENLDEQCDGLLIHSENFQALNLLQERYWEQVKCIYIDPPYNTDASPIMYKNEYRCSSWVCLMDDRLRSSIPLLAKDGILTATVDDFQQKELHSLIINAFGKSNFLGTVVIRNNPSGRPAQTGFSISHEYAIFAAVSSQSSIGKLDRTEKQNKRYNQLDEHGQFMWELLRKRGSDSERKDSPKLYYPLYISSKSIRVPEMEWDQDKRTWIVKEEAKEDEIEAYPVDENDVERRWRWGVENTKSNCSQLKAEKNGEGAYTIYYKYRPPQGTLPTTNWIDSKYSATEHGTGLLKTFFKEYDPFSFPKSVYAVEDCIKISGIDRPYSICLDYFAGSGTTGHAVVNLNRADGGKRKYILVEMGDYFDTVLVPRIKKVVYSKDWKDGKPVSREGVSHMFKYISLESYEDTLANLELKRTDAQQKLLDLSDSFRESYMLKYMLDTESMDSQSLLNIDAFEDPFNYKLLVGTGSVGETKAVNVDLVETFNWLLGLRVRHMDHIRGFRVVEGMSPDDEKVLIIWRNIKEKSNEDLEDFFRKRQYNTMDMEFDVIYVNGDNNLMNLPMAGANGDVEPRYKVRLIEEDFKRLMFDVKDV
ncbi:MAG: site-specific DNA-methyltransferase [Deltaproteobacteria bacterium]|nr:site-specific DNA-methyltransferase [Deltaproteobacteria bacterium]